MWFACFYGVGYWHIAWLSRVFLGDLLYFCFAHSRLSSYERRVARISGVLLD
jgi:hypothetical protein